MTKGNNKDLKLSPALGIFFGSAIGTIYGVLTKNNIALAAAFGAGIGLVIGSVILTIAINKEK